jgi:transketolase
MAVISPADEVETRQATRAIADWPGPAYLRLGRYPVPRLFDGDYRFEIGRLVTLREGGDVVIFATGHMVCKSLEAAEQLAGQRIEARVVNVSTLKPLDGAAVRAAAGGAGLAVSVEEHSIIGGLGSALAECLSESETAPRLLRLGVQDRFGESGLADELLEKHRLTGPLIAEDIRRALG